MAADRIWPDDYTFGWASTPAPKFENLCEHKPAQPPLPVAASREDLAQFNARRWCIEQVVATRANAPSLRPVHEDAAALYAFLTGNPA